MREGPPFHVLVGKLLARVSSLSYFHCGERWETDYRGWIEQAEAVRERMQRDATIVEPPSLADLVNTLAGARVVVAAAGGAGFAYMGQNPQALENGIATVMAINHTAIPAEL